MLNKFKKLAKNIFIQLFSPTIVKKRAKMVYISYLPEAYIKSEGDKYFSKHQNRLESLTIGRVIESLGMGYIIERFDKCIIRKFKCDIVFGLEPNFERIAKHNPSAIKIYYATGSYYEHQNTMIYSRTDSFNKSHNCNLSYNRLVTPHNSAETADYIFQIGSQKTINTYPEHLRHKICIIRQSCQNFPNYDINSKLKSYSKTDFLWFGGKGSILKGLDLIIDYFLTHTQYNIHIIGPIDSDFLSYYKNAINTSSNIHCYGFMDLNDFDFIEKVQKCSCIIFPSCSEGLPGTVINAMKLGVIPILSKWCSIDCIETLGYEMESLSTDSIDNAIKWFNSLSDSSIKDLFLANSIYANETYNLKSFENDMLQMFDKILKQNIYDHTR